MKRLTSLIWAVLVTGALLPLHAADFTWDGGGDGWTWVTTQGANWSGAGSAPNAAGDTATITSNWPTVNSGYIQIRQLTTIGVLTIDTSSATASVAGFNRQAGGMEFIFDNNGSNAQVNGSGSKDLRFNGTPITVNDTVEFNISNLPQVQINNGITGTGGLTITGNSVSASQATGSNNGNDVYFRGGTFDYTGETRIDSGVLQFHQGVTSLGSSSIVVNGEWDLDAVSFAGTGYFLLPAQTLSGTGTIVMGNSNPTNSLRSDGATIAPGDGGVGTLTITRGGLSLTGGTFQFEVGEAASDQIVPNRLFLSGTPGTVAIAEVPADKRTSFGTVVLFDYGGTLSGDVADLSLILPAGWGGTLVDSGTSIDLNITELPGGTVIRIR